MGEIRCFGIRHHGPGSARSLRAAFATYQPDCVLIEGPPEGNDLIARIGHADLVPPVALLSYCPEQSGLASYHPFAEFSPEWQALRHAVAARIAVRFIDLPMANSLALEAQRRQPEQIPAIVERTGAESDQEAPTEDVIAANAEDAADLADAAEIADPESPPDEADRAQDPFGYSRDPLDYLAHAAGYADGEAWWNHMVEERGDGADLFAAIAEAMTELRAQVGERLRAADRPEESAREAHMRQCIRAAQKEGFARIAVVCGAWHVPALLAHHTAKADAAVLKALPKIKVACTWIPWTYRHLTRASGYGAGIESPGWYEHLFEHGGDARHRSVAWLARVARALRARDLDCSSAHLIETARLAETLAALRDRPAPSLDELDQACRSVLAMGEAGALAFIDRDVKVGDRLGRVPADVPTVPLVRDVEAEQKRLRLKAEALDRSLELDLRQANDLARSRLLHRLRLLGIDWGHIEHAGQGRGTFRELWRIQWQPEFALTLIEASQYGQTLIDAASAKVRQDAESETSVAALAGQLDAVLLADLPDAVTALTLLLEARASASGDAWQLLPAIAPLANVFRYGNVRRTDAGQISHVLDSMIVRAAIGLPNACCGMADEVALSRRGDVLSAHQAIALRDDESLSRDWRRALSQVADRESAAPLLRGLAIRLLRDDEACSPAHVAERLAFALSSAADPNDAGHWLDGFLNRNALVLLHDDALFQLVDDWMAGLSETNFVAVLPLVRRCFSEFEAGDRRDLAHRAARAGSSPRQARASQSDLVRARAVVPMLAELMGLSP